VTRKIKQLEIEGGRAP